MYGARTPHSERARELSWQRLLKRALTGEGVVSHFQPIVDLYRGTVIGYEALARFQGYPVPDPAQWFAAARRHGRAPQLEAPRPAARRSTRAPDLPAEHVPGAQRRARTCSTTPTCSRSGSSTRTSPAW